MENISSRESIYAIAFWKEQEADEGGEIGSKPMGQEEEGEEKKKGRKEGRKAGYLRAVPSYFLSSPLSLIFPVPDDLNKLRKPEAWPSWKAARCLPNATSYAGNADPTATFFKRVSIFHTRPPREGWKIDKTTRYTPAMFSWNVDNQPKVPFPSYLSTIDVNFGIYQSRRWNFVYSILKSLLISVLEFINREDGTFTYVYWKKVIEDDLPLSPPLSLFLLLLFIYDRR